MNREDVDNQSRGLKQFSKKERASRKPWMGSFNSTHWIVSKSPVCPDLTQIQLIYTLWQTCSFARTEKRFDSLAFLNAIIAPTYDLVIFAYCFMGNLNLSSKPDSLHQFIHNTQNIILPFWSCFFSYLEVLLLQI